MCGVENICYRWVYRAQTSHLVHENFISAKCNKSCSTERMRRHKNGKIFGVLSDQTHDAPWNRTGATITVDEKIYTVFCYLPASL